MNFLNLTSVSEGNVVSRYFISRALATLSLFGKAKPFVQYWYTLLRLGSVLFIELH